MRKPKRQPIVISVRNEGRLIMHPQYTKSTSKKVNSGSVMRSGVQTILNEYKKPESADAFIPKSLCVSSINNSNVPVSRKTCAISPTLGEGEKILNRLETNTGYPGERYALNVIP